jgi:hypothetical protein
MNVKEMEEMVKNYGGGRSKEVEASQEELNFRPRIVIDPVVYHKVMHWVNRTDIEVSGLGKVIFDEETNTLRVIDAIMLPQKNTAATTELDGAAVAKAMFLLRDTPGHLRWWWHSHANMGVFWSGTDIDTIKQLGGGGWYCATVFNRKYEMKSAFCQKAPVQVLLPELITEVGPSKELVTQWDSEFDKNVEEQKYSFRESYRYPDEEIERQWNEYVQEREASLKETPQKNDGEGECVVSKDAMGNVIKDFNVSFKKKQNLVPVSQLKERSIGGINPKTGQLEMADLASDAELEEWNRSTSDEEEVDVLSDEEVDEVLNELAVDEYLKRNS